VSDSFVTVGRLGRTRGVAGEIYIIPETDFPDRFLDMNEIFIRHKDGWKKTRLESSRIVSGRPVIKLEGIDTPEDAARLTNREVGVREEEIANLPEGSFWIHDLIGCEVVEENSETRLGEITGVERYPANDVYLIKTEDGKEVMIAAVEQFIKNVDTTARKVTIDKAGIIEP
jgi:16S rRNA processing protein RimM